MRSLTFSDEPGYPLVFLVPSIRRDEIRKEYLDACGIPHHEAKVLALHYDPANPKKTTATERKRFVVEELVPSLGADVRYLVVADAEYYKLLASQDKAERDLGYVRDCAYGPWKVVYVPNYRAVWKDPIGVRARIVQALDSLVAHATGSYYEPGDGIIHFEAYPRTDEEIAAWLERLLAMDRDLTVDIEAFSLKHHDAGIGTITLCWSKHEGIAFPVDYVPIEGATQAPFGRQERNEARRELLRSFFRRLQRRATYHGITYDVYVLIFQLFMKDLLDQAGMYEGMEILLRNWDCTKLITYLATNTCAGNKLSLKDQAQEFAGNYAQTDEDIKDITRIPLDKLLRYNLIDGLSTWHVLEKNWPILVADRQEDVYRNLFRPAVLDIIQMQLTGLPLDMDRVLEVEQLLAADEQKALATIRQSQVVQRFTYRLREEYVARRNQELKKKRITLADPEVQAVEFNPNSHPQLQELLHGMLGLPVLDLTDSKQPATGTETLEKLVHHTADPDVQAFLKAMIDYADVYKIITGFLPAMKAAPLAPDGWHYLYGNFNLGGTVSGRLSSNNPNLQNLPAKSRYAKLIKSCFRAPPGWLFVGLDFASLEDRISALTTKDPNKLKVYTEGYDGHCLRAYAYFHDRMPDIDPASVDSINSIKKKYPDERQDSKSPTFALTYQGTFRTLMVNCGFSEELARQVETRYHELYVVSDRWVQAKLARASRDGYVTCAFGLRLRTPLLAQTLRGCRKTPFEAEAEGRTAGNALGQSWCLLNSRAGSEFMGKVRRSGYRLDIRPCAQIHDAQYYLVRDDMDALLYTNTHLVEAVNWQDHPDIAHDEVHLGGALSIFWPDWAHELEIPNGATESELRRCVDKFLEAA